MQLATAGRTRWKSVMSPLTDKDHSRRESEGFVWLSLRVFSSATFCNFGTVRFMSSRHTHTHTHTHKQVVSHYWSTLHCTHQLWHKHGRLQAVSWLDHGGRKSYTYATFIEDGMVAAHGTPRHSTNNRINFLDQDARWWNYIRLHSHQGRLLPLHNQQLAGAKVSQLHIAT
jgi:hypothetical protein